MAQEILISRGWRISTDTHNYVLEKRYENEKKGGEEYWMPTGYFNSLHNLMVAYLHEKPRTSKGPLLDEIRQACKEVEELIERIGVELTFKVVI